MEIDLTARAENDLEDLPVAVRDTFFSKLESTEKNLSIGASPGQAFDKYLSGNMHLALQMNLGRDYRSWFVEGEHIQELDDEKIYCVKVLDKKEAQKLVDRIPDFLIFVGSSP